MKRKRLTLALDNTTHDRMKYLKDERDVNISAFIRRAINNEYEKLTEGEDV